MLVYILFILSVSSVSADMTTEEVQFLNELPLDRLLTLRNSLQEFVTKVYDNITTTTPNYLESFGAHALAMKGPPIKRTDYEEGLHKKDEFSKISNIFSMSVTTLAFLAFGGYLLCLIVQAVKSKQNSAAATPQPTFFVNAGIKKPQSHFVSSYGRRKRENRDLNELQLPPDQLFTALLQFCEGYAKWSNNTLSSK